MTFCMMVYQWCDSNTEFGKEYSDNNERIIDYCIDNYLKDDDVWRNFLINIGAK